MVLMLSTCGPLCASTRAHYDGAAATANRPGACAGHVGIQNYILVCTTCADARIYSSISVSRMNWDGVAYAFDLYRPNTGMIPSADALRALPRSFRMTTSWRLSLRHNAKTSRRISYCLSYGERSRYVRGTHLDRAFAFQASERSSGENSHDYKLCCRAFIALEIPFLVLLKSQVKNYKRGHLL